MYNYSKHILPNGLRVVTIPMADTAAVSILILAKVGSRNESKKINGLSHFLEHMVFKGTKKRPNTLEIATFLDSLGAEFNAFTGEEYTGFYIKSQAKDFKQSLEMLNDMLFDSLFDPTEVEREKGVITAEINMYKDDPKLYIYTLGQKLLYGDTPLGRDIAGDEQTVRSFKKEDFIEYRDSFYHPDNLLVAVAGSQNTDWLNEIETLLGGLKKRQSIPVEPFIDNQTSPAINLHYRKTDQAHLMAAFKTFSRFDSRRYAMTVLDNLLGGTMSSRLFITVRERHGLCYYVRSGLDFYHDTGDIAISAGVELGKIEKALELITQEIKKIKTEKVTVSELNKAKENICGRFSLSLEESLDVARYFGTEELLSDKIEDPADFAKKIRAVTAEEVLSLAQEIFDFNKINFALVGPYKEKEKFLEIFK